MSAKIIL